MAVVRLKDVEVMRVNRTGNGVQVAEKFTAGGKERQTRFTVWFDEPHGLSVGDVVSVSGFLGAKVGDPWTGDDGVERRSVELSVNRPRIEAGSGSGGGSPAGAGQPSSGGDFGGQGGFDDEQPF